MEFVWVFNGDRAKLPVAAFTSREIAQGWIAKHAMSGILTKYPLDIPVYDFAIQNGWFTPDRDDQRTPEFIQGFTSASQEHYHYENDILDVAKTSSGR